MSLRRRVPLSRTLAATWILPALLLTLPAAAAAPDAAPQADDSVDPWKGKLRAEIVAWLGEPDRAKKKQGTEVMTYKVTAVGEEAVPSAEFRVIRLPEVGRVGRRIHVPNDSGEIVTIAPTEVNERGETTAGGVATTRSRSVSRRMGEDGRLEPAEVEGGAEGAPAGTRLKLQFVLDGSGRVTEWSVTGGGKR